MEGAQKNPCAGALEAPVSVAMAAAALRGEVAIAPDLLSWLAAVPVALSAPFVHVAPTLAARLFTAFARAEWESALDLHGAAIAARSPEVAALLLAHAADERRHTQLFAARARSLDDRYGDPSQVEAAIGPSGLADRGLVPFLAFVHHGELRALAQLRVRAAICEAAGDLPSARLCRLVAADEARHAAYSKALLVAMTGSTGAAAKALRRARGGEFVDLLPALGAPLVAPAFAVLAAALYLVVGPLARLTLLGARRGR